MKHIVRAALTCLVGSLTDTSAETVLIDSGVDTLKTAIDSNAYADSFFINGDTNGTGTSNELTQFNVLFILVDDWGWMDVGYNGGVVYETPNMDALAGEWMQFDNCYTPSPGSMPAKAQELDQKLMNYLNQTGAYIPVAP